MSLISWLVPWSQAGNIASPEWKPHSFQEGEIVELQVNKMTSSSTFMPIEHYSLPFCRPSEVVTTSAYDNLGGNLLGDRVQNSPYYLLMKNDMFCEQLCVTNLGQNEQLGMANNNVVKAIRRNYENNWMVNNLPPATKVDVDKLIISLNGQGFPLGYVDKNTNLAYIYNHVNIEIIYREVEIGPPGHYYVSRFTIEPSSIKHEIEPMSPNDHWDMDDNHFLPRNYKILNPIPSCNPQTSPKVHTTHDMVTGMGREPQLASGSVLFTYDVIWKEESNDQASRWDVYMTMNEAIPPGLNIPNLTVAFVLAACIAAILVLRLRRDIHGYGYDRITKSEEGRVEKEKEREDGWKVVPADLFPLPANPMRLSILCGTGAQLLCTSICIVLFSAGGFIPPATPGRFLSVALLLFALLGGINGYVTARLYRSFLGKSSMRPIAYTALVYPGTAFGMFLLTNAVAVNEQSSAAASYTTILTLLALWFGILVPLVFVGAFLAYQQGTTAFPLATSDIPRQNLGGNLHLTLCIGCIFHFVSGFWNLSSVFHSLWFGNYYVITWFSFLAFVTLIMICAEISILFTYLMLRGEDYHWWWRSFESAGSFGIYICLYSIGFFLAANSFLTFSVAAYIVYFGYMALISASVFLMMGCVGVFSSLWFNQFIFACVKDELLL